VHKFFLFTKRFCLIKDHEAVYQSSVIANPCFRLNTVHWCTLTIRKQCSPLKTWFRSKDSYLLQFNAMCLILEFKLPHKEGYKKKGYQIFYLSLRLLHYLLIHGNEMMYYYRGRIGAITER
jgi:hypothetical protein